MLDVFRKGKLLIITLYRFLSLTIKDVSSCCKGKGLVACKAFGEGDVILEEKPVVSSQFSWNELYQYKACDHCLRSLETAEAMARRLANDQSLSLSYPECCDVDLSQISPCPQCQMLYCSPACRDLALSQYHQVLCLGRSRDDPGHPLNALMEVWRSFHYPPESTSAMLIAKMIALVKQAADKGEVLNKFSGFCQAAINEHDDLAHKLLGKQFETQRDVLRSQFMEVLHEESVQEWFQPDGFNRLVALIGTNGQGIASSSFSRWVKHVEEKDLDEQEKARVDAEIEKIYEQMDEVSGDFLDCEGSGLYQQQSACNHSCSPNSEIKFVHGDNTLSLVAVRDISPEEEVTISYLSCCDTDRSRHSRQRMLRENYLFKCTCDKCLSQADDASVTSDDDEEEEMEDDN